MNVSAYYNVNDDTKLLHDDLDSQCEFEVKKRCSPAPGGLHIRGLTTEGGRLDRSDGSIEIIAVAHVGKFDAAVPSISYSLTLNTDAQHLEEDLKIFRVMLDTVKIAPRGH